MKKLITFALVFFVILFWCKCYAASTKFSLEIAAIDFSYTEYGQGMTLDEDNGGIFGLRLGIEHVTSECLWMRGIGSYQIGTNIIYRGHYMDGTPVVGHGALHFVWNIEGDMGYSLRESKFLLVPYVGIGYRYWHRGKTEDLAGDYNEKYSWGYVPVGLKFVYGLSDRILVGIDIALTLPFDMSMEAEVGDGNKFDLGWRPGFKASLPLEFNLTKRVALSLIPSYQYWTIGSSKAVNGLYEPESVTQQLGGFLAISWYF